MGSSTRPVHLPFYNRIASCKFVLKSIYYAAALPFYNRIAGSIDGFSAGRGGPSIL